MTRSIQKLVTDVETRGMRIERKDNRLVLTSRSGHLGVAVYLTEHGGFWTAIRTDIPLGVTTSLRTLKEVRKVLGL